MTDTLPASTSILGRFPLFATASQAEAEARLNASLAGRRTFLKGGSARTMYALNHLRLGACTMASVSMTPSVVRGENDGMGTVYFPVKGGLELRYGGRALACEPGSIACLMPAGDRVVAYEGGHESLLVRIAPEVLHDCMDVHGHVPGGDWSRIFSAIPAGLPQAAALARLVADIAATYDDPEGSPDRQLDTMFGRSIALALADLLVVVSGGSTSPAPSYVIAQRAEEVLMSRFRDRLTVFDVARTVGATIPEIRRSMLCYRGLGPEEFLAYVRLVAVGEFVRAGLDERAAVQRAGFASPRAHRAALRRLGEFRRNLGAVSRVTGASELAA